MERLTAHAKLWLKLHSSNEYRFARDLRTYFNDQLERVIVALQDYSQVSSVIIPQVFRADDEYELLMRIVRPHIITAMGTAARTQMEMLGAVDGKSFDGVGVEFDLPDRVLNAMRSHWVELEQAPYWREMQKVTATRITGIIEEGVQQRLGIRRIAKLLNERLGGEFSKARAKAIARTEMTGAMNAGHQASYDEAAGDGVVVGKSWLTVGDTDVRLSHASINGQTVKINVDFEVPIEVARRRRRRKSKRRRGTLIGTEPAPFPGWWGLSPANRVNCRCTTLAVLADEFASLS